MILTHAAYGKSAIRLVKLSRRGDRHDLCDLTIAIRFEGDYDDSYTAGDNRAVLPTDTMKNTVYALAAQDPLDQPETFGLTLSRRFLDRNPRLQRVTIDLAEHPWGRIDGAGRETGHSFIRQGHEIRTARVSASRGDTTVEAGIRDALILKSSQSAFADFLRDELTTLPDTNDRILATSLTATWRYAGPVEFGASWTTVRRQLLDTFASHQSASVQHTLYAMAQAVLDTVLPVASVHLVMPNKHHLPVDLTRFGLENRNEIFVATDEPFGLIEATLERR
jgi:urate oxidase